MSLPSLWRHSEYGVFSPQDDGAYEMVTASQMRLCWHYIARPVSWSILKKMASNSLLYVLLDLHQSCCASCTVSCTSVLTKRVGPGDTLCYQLRILKEIHLLLLPYPCPFLWRAGNQCYFLCTSLSLQLLFSGGSVFT